MGFSFLSNAVMLVLNAVNRIHKHHCFVQGRNFLYPTNKTDLGLGTYRLFGIVVGELVLSIIDYSCNGLIDFGEK